MFCPTPTPFICASSSSSACAKKNDPKTRCDNGIWVAMLPEHNASLRRVADTLNLHVNYGGRARNLARSKDNSEVGTTPFIFVPPVFVSAKINSKDSEASKLRSLFFSSIAAQTSALRFGRSVSVPSSFVF